MTILLHLIRGHGRRVPQQGTTVDLPATLIGRQTARIYRDEFGWSLEVVSETKCPQCDGEGLCDYEQRWCNSATASSPRQWSGECDMCRGSGVVRAGR